MVVRLYRIDTHSHFMTDESSDLVRMHQIYVERMITLVGPISEDRSHVFSSLTYYMLLPFAVMFNFDPLGPVVGMVFWGSLTAIMLAMAIKKINPNFTFIGAIFVSLWWPLVLGSRWAWNPNLVAFWIVLGWHFCQKKVSWMQLLGGLFMGLAVHHHYLAILPIGVYLLINRNGFFAAGLAAAWLPFVAFDLRHPPGLFIMRSLNYYSGTKQGFELHKSILMAWSTFSEYFFPQISQVFVTIGISALVGWDILRHKAYLFGLANWIVALVGLILLSFQFHYVLPVAVFFVLWIFAKRNGFGKVVQLIIIITIICGSILKFSKEISSYSLYGNLKETRQIVKIISDQITTQKLVNPNLAILASDDIYTNGNKYRDLLLVNNIRLRMASEYEISDNLFVVTQKDEQTIRDDPAAERAKFRPGPLYGYWQIPNSSWRVYQFNKY